MNYGFVQPLIEESHYVLGGLSSLSKTIVRKDGQWDDVLPTYETQYGENFDTDNCTAYGTENAIEMLQQAKYGEQPNYSERALGIMAGTYPPGNDPHVVCEVIRKQGLIYDAQLPLEAVHSVKEYYSPKPLQQSLTDQAKAWLNQYSFGHEWVVNSLVDKKVQADRMKEALTYSPLLASVDAWHYGADDKCYRKGEDNHWCVIYGYVDGAYWSVFDSYSGFTKQLVWDFGFTYVKRINLERNEQIAKNKPLIIQTIQLLLNALKQLLTLSK